MHSPHSPPQILTDFTVNLENSYDFIYSGPVYVGSEAAEGEVIYDTGSSVLTITSTSCSNCDTYVYNPSTSTTSIKESTTI
jgi:hypothetical protein